ncbi:MAG: L,D-transpeptidase family protein [Hyphomicrobiaceae bacterium]
MSFTDEGSAVPSRTLPRGGGHSGALLSALVAGIAMAAAAPVFATSAVAETASERSGRSRASSAHVPRHSERAIRLARGSAQAERSTRERNRAIRTDDQPEPSKPLLAIVSLASQHIVVHGPNGVLHRSRVSTGKSGNATPTGVFSVLQRRRYHESNIYSSAPMPYMQRLTWSGIALHEGYVPNYPASHGCIRLPGAFARKLWQLGEIGMRVVVSPKDISPVSVRHAKLPQPLRQPVERVASVIQVANAADDTLPPIEQASSLSPYAAAHARLANAKAAKLVADRAVKPAYALAAEKSAEARRLAEAVKASAGIVDDTEEYRALEQFGLATVQTEEAEAPILVRLRLAEASVAAARQAHVKLQAAEAEASKAAFAAAATAREARKAAEAAAAELTAARLGVKPLTVFVSRRTGLVYLRQGSQPLAQEPVAVADPDQPIGTHVFTAIDDSSDGTEVRWAAITVPTSGGLTRKQRNSASYKSPSKASEALDRITFPPVITQLMSQRVWPGVSIIVSDYGLGETNDGTDFVILTH